MLNMDMVFAALLLLLLPALAIFDLRHAPQAVRPDLEDRE